ncbi:MAG: UvrB/UvrC motif-containing protein [Kiritimatiellae bacterium]|nr:UvrB/UvrC motif-containing protein [Kiritimatiellia bacterium]
MICELCNLSEATVYLKQVIDGSEKELFVCEECSGKHSPEISSPMGMSDFLFGVGVKNSVKAEAPVKDEVSCSHCHMRQSDFTKRSRMGCEHCYDVFKEELQPMLAMMHKGYQHKGKVPQNAKLAMSLESLELDLATAIESQDFEKAALIRDSIAATK